MTTEQPDKNIRVFFALWPNEHERAALAAWQPALQKLCGGKATRPGNLHATLVFLGGVAGHRLESLKLAAQELQDQKFDLTLNLAHYWGHNHIVHAAPEVVPPHLPPLVRSLEQGLIRHRFHFDNRPEYKPHITLLRHARWTDAPLPAMPKVTWHIKNFALVQSLDSEDGVVYQVLEQFPLH
ncbi:MAG TPA: RNA 2',3'-cyclic phosphodiesterase [Gallionellaceae bacterium]